MSDEIEKPVPGQGEPMLPKQAIPYAAGVVAIASSILMFLPADSLGFKICTVIIGLGSLFGIASPGMRRK